MRQLIRSKIFLIILFWVLAVELFAKEEKEIKQVPAPAPSQPQLSTRPILPPQVPSVPPTVAPTPSPHIATPLTDTGLIMKQTTPVSNIPTVPSMPNIPKVPNLPSQLPTGKFSPAQPQVPGRPILPTQIPQIPTIPKIPSRSQTGVPSMQQLPLLPSIGRVIGKVLLIDNDEAGNPFIEVEDSTSKITHKIKINPNSTKVIKSKEAIKLSDVETGDTVMVLYMERTGQKLAFLIRLLTPQDLELINKTKSETIAKPEDLLKQGVPVEEKKGTAK